MKPPEPNLLTTTGDWLLKPFMYLLNGFKFPLQETHHWHCVNISNDFQNIDLLHVHGNEVAKFGHDSQFGLYHMPILGGLRGYVVVEAKGFKDHWHIGWKHSGNLQVSRLRIKENRLKLLHGTSGINVFAADDNGKFLSLQIVGYGRIGDGKYKGIRLL